MSIRCRTGGEGSLKGGSRGQRALYFPVKMFRLVVVKKTWEGERGGWWGGEKEWGDGAGQNRSHPSPTTRKTRINLKVRFGRKEFRRLGNGRGRGHLGLLGS